MATFNVRPIHSNDLKALSTLWQQIMVERALMDRRVRLVEDACEIWQAELARHLENTNVKVWVAEQPERLIGYLIGWVLERPTLYLQQRYGFISDLGVDGHAHQGGVGTALFEAAKPWFEQKGVEIVEIEVMHHHPIAQAFWRAQGATEYFDHLWCKLRKPDE